ncbi:unnamed protein product [Arctogadus glacialis]
MPLDGSVGIVVLLRSNITTAQSLAWRNISLSKLSSSTRLRSSTSTGLKGAAAEGFEPGSLPGNEIREALSDVEVRVSLDAPAATLGNVGAEVARQRKRISLYLKLTYTQSTGVAVAMQRHTGKERHSPL